jgi:hypothetical protein
MGGPALPLGRPALRPAPGRTAQLAMVLAPVMAALVGRVDLIQVLGRVLDLVTGLDLDPVMGLGLDPAMGPVLGPGLDLRTVRVLADRQQAPSTLLHLPATHLNRSATGAIGRPDLVGRKIGCDRISGSHPLFLPSKKRGVPHISLVFREMWDTTNLNLFSTFRKKNVERCGIPHLAKNKRDMGHPTLLGREKAGSDR